MLETAVCGASNDQEMLLLEATDSIMLLFAALVAQHNLLILGKASAGDLGSSNIKSLRCILEERCRRKAFVSIRACTVRTPLHGVSRQCSSVS